MPAVPLYRKRGTRVLVDRRQQITSVYYHGTEILRVTPRRLRVYCGSWYSATTAARMNEACREFAPPPGLGWSVNRCQGWYILRAPCGARSGTFGPNRGAQPLAEWFTVFAPPDLALAWRDWARRLAETVRASRGERPAVNPPETEPPRRGQVEPEPEPDARRPSRRPRSLAPVASEDDNPAEGNV